MTYIELLNRFWELDEQHGFSPEASRLYFYLLKVANKSRPAWPETIERADTKTAVDNGMSLKRMKKWRTELEEAGLITVIAGGNGAGNRVSYKISGSNLVPKGSIRCANRAANRPPNEPIRCAKQPSNQPPNADKVGEKVGDLTTYSIYTRLKTFYTLSKRGVRKKMSVFLSVKKQGRKAPLVRRIPPKPAPAVPVTTVRGDPFFLRRDSENLAVPFSTWWPAYAYVMAEATCRRLWIDLTDEERLLVMEHTPPYVKATPDKRWRKSPVNYLEDKAFNDEIINRHANDTLSKPGPGGREILRTEYTQQKFKRSRGPGAGRSDAA